MLWVTFLFHVSFHGFDFIQVFDYTEQLHHNEFKQKWRVVFLYLNLALTGLTPLFGWIADARLAQKFICLRRIAHSFSLLQIIGIGVFMQGIGTLGFAIIEVVGHKMNPNASCMLQPNDNPIVIPIDYNWLLIPLFLKTVGHLIGYLTLLKFIIAQCPIKWKAFCLGLILDWQVWCILSDTMLTNGINLWIIQPPAVPFIITSLIW